MSLARWSIARPVTATMFFVSLLAVGIISGSRLPLEAFPDVQFPAVFVQIPYQGASPEQVERDLTRPAEEVLATIPGVRTLNSQSSGEGAFIFMFFGWGEDVSTKLTEVREKLEQARPQMPGDVQRFLLFKWSSSDEAFLNLRLSSNRSLQDEYELLEKQVKRRLERIPGVARVELAGVEAPELAIELDADRLSAAGVEIPQIVAVLESANFALSGGDITDSGQRFRVEPQGELTEVSQLADLVLNTNGVRLRDVATVGLKPPVRDYARRLEMREAIGLELFKERGANLVEVGRRAQQEIELIKQLPAMEGIEIFTLEDQASGVIASLKELISSGLIGLMLAVFVLYAFLRHWASTLMVAVSIPLAIAMTLAAMHFAGVSLNILSLMGLLLAVGMLVDNAVVVVESIYQERARLPEQPVAAAIAGSNGVALAVSAGTLTSVVVFAPNLFGERTVLSIYLSQVAIAITFALLSSWLIAISLIPMLAARLRSPPPLHSAGWLTSLATAYGACLRWSLRNRLASIGVLVLLLVVSFVPAFGVKFDAFPQGEQRAIALNYRLNAAYRLPALEENVAVIERFLNERREEYEIRSMYSYVSEIQGMSTRLLLTEDGSSKRTTAEITEALRNELPKLPIGEISFGFDQGPGGGGGDSNRGFSVNLEGESGAVLRELAPSVIAALGNVEGLRDIEIQNRRREREIQVRVDQQRAAQVGLNSEQIARVVAIALRGTPLREFRSSAGEVSSTLRFADAEASSIESLSDFKLKTPDGARVPLVSLIEIETVNAADAVLRSNRRTSLTLTATLAPEAKRDEVRGEVSTLLDGYGFPPGYGYNYGVDLFDGSDVGQRMAFNLLIALVLIYFVMAALFESPLFPTAILASVVYSAGGVFWLFFATGTTFSVMAWIGVLVLLGVVVNNGVVLIEHFHNLRRSGMLRTEALVTASRERLRPILMTVGTTVLGMLPLCFEGARLAGDGPPYYPMARAIVGGLIYSTIVTLVAVPLLYSLLDDLRIASERYFGRLGGRLPTADPG